MASFSLFPKIETEEELKRRADKRMTQFVQSAVTAPDKDELPVALEVTESNVNDTAATAAAAAAAAAETPLQRQPSKPNLSARSKTRAQQKPQKSQTSDKPEKSHKTTTAQAAYATPVSPGLYSLPTPPIANPSVPSDKVEEKSAKPDAAPAPSMASIETRLITTSPPRIRTHSRPNGSSSSSTITPSSATTRSSASAFSPASTRSSTHSTVYSPLALTQSPTTAASSPPRTKAQRKIDYGALPPPPPLPQKSQLSRSNTTATHSSSSTIRSAATRVTAQTSTTRSTAKPVRASTAPAARSIFPVFDPSRSLAEQQHSYALHHGASRPMPRRSLTQKALQEAEHEFAPPPSRWDTQSMASGITRANTARSLTSRSAVYPLGTAAKSSSSLTPLQRQQTFLDEKRDLQLAISKGSAPVTFPPAPSQQPARPSTSSGTSSAAKEKPDAAASTSSSNQHGVAAAALDACAFVLGVGVEVVGGAMGGLKRGVRKERAKRQQRSKDDKSSQAVPRKNRWDRRPDGEGDDRGQFGSPRQESPGWVVGRGDRKVTDFRI